jgi:hypothetical protein
LNYDDQYVFGGDILVYYKIKEPEAVVLSAAEAELRDLLTDYHPENEIKKAIEASTNVPKAAVVQADKKTEALVSTVKECKSALERYDELMNEIDGYSAT